jgi:hypothetical protein
VTSPVAPCEHSQVILGFQRYYPRYQHQGYTGIPKVDTLCTHQVVTLMMTRKMVSRSVEVGPSLSTRSLYTIHPVHKYRFEEDDLVVVIKTFSIWPKGLLKVKPMENGQGWMDDPVPMTLTIKAPSLSCRCNTL